jgi:hypothetical protein
MKICKKCKINKPLDNFNKNKNIKGGLHIWCKKCSSLQNKERYENKKEEIKEKSSQYYSLNREIILPKLKTYREQDFIKEKQKNYIKEWVLNNKDSYRKYQNNYTKQRRKNDPYFKTIESLKNQINHFLKNKKKDKKTEILLGYTYKDFIEKLGVIEEKQDLDHKIPISWFKKDTPINVIWDLRNLQITSREYNRKKKNLYADPINKEFYQTVTKWIEPTQLSMILTYL